MWGDTCWLVRQNKTEPADRSAGSCETHCRAQIRSGYGIYFGNDIGNISFGTNPPYSYSATLTPDPTIPSLFLRTGLPPNLLTPANARNISLGAEDPNRRNPYNQQWNFTIQQQLRGEILVEIGYVGATAHRIQQTNDINSPPPGPGQAN